MTDFQGTKAKAEAEWSNAKAVVLAVQPADVTAAFASVVAFSQTVAEAIKLLEAREDLNGRTNNHDAINALLANSTQMSAMAAQAQSIISAIQTLINGVTP